MTDTIRTAGARRRLARSRGALSGLLLVVFGAWAALIPFIGPYFDYSYTPNSAWTWTAARGWLEVLPGCAAVLAGVLIIGSTSRATTLFASWLGIAAGAWLIVGIPFAPVMHTGDPGAPSGTNLTVRSLESVGLFYGVGAVILFLAAAAFGRLSVVSMRDLRAAERRQQAAGAEYAAAQRAREEAERDAATHREAEREAPERNAAAGESDRPSESEAGPEDREHGAYGATSRG